MKVIIELSECYDWQSGFQAEYDALWENQPVDVPEGTDPPADAELGDDDVYYRRVFTGDRSEWSVPINGTGIIKRATIPCDTFTEINIHPDQLNGIIDSSANRLRHIQDLGRAVAFVVEENAMPNEAPRSGWKSITVETGDDTAAEVSTFLNSYFGMGGNK